MSTTDGLSHPEPGHFDVGRNGGSGGVERSIVRADTPIEHDNESDASAIHSRVADLRQAALMEHASEPSSIRKLILAFAIAYKQPISEIEALTLPEVGYILGSLKLPKGRKHGHRR